MLLVFGSGAETLPVLWIGIFVTITVECITLPLAVWDSQP
jgi:hypothetical protein